MNTVHTIGVVNDQCIRCCCTTRYNGIYAKGFSVSVIGTTFRSLSSHRHGTKLLIISISWSDVMATQVRFSSITGTTVP